MYLRYIYLIKVNTRITLHMKMGCIVHCSSFKYSKKWLIDGGFTGVCTAGIHSKKLPLHVEEADIRVVAERGVHQPAALLGEPRYWAYESPWSPFRVSLFVSGARSHKNGEMNWFSNLCYFRAAFFQCIWPVARWKYSVLTIRKKRYSQLCELPASIIRGPGCSLPACRHAVSPLCAPVWLVII